MNDQIMNKALAEVSEKIAQNTEKQLNEQLSDLTKRGLLVIEIGPVQLYSYLDHATGETKINVGSSIKLKLKDQEYIEQLESRNKELEDLLFQIKKVAK